MSERNELVARLRKDVYYGDARLHNMSRHNPLHADAANQIERDGREIERLREALRQIDKMAYDQNCSKLYPHDADGWEAALDDMQTTARAALNGEGET